ncbi:pyridoxal phosphate-dependent transferase [Aspergillus granulosus]|uniref:Pyridoxal phosphate-dependent transferase n=1 Tax=Aspergillus granulosus TaxID=176169 RepID=A0ABR4H3N4_9EURO
MSPKPTTAPINLSSGFPSPSLFPLQQLSHATDTVLATPSIWHEGMIYGPDEGHFPLRENLARWLSRFYHPDPTTTTASGSVESDPKIAIDAERICITGGASQNLACLLQVFTDPVFTKNVFIVEPGYFLSFRVFEDAGFAGRLTGVPEDEGGVDIGFLEERLQEDERSISPDIRPFKPPRPYRKLYRHIIYCVPTFSNPSGRIMSLPRRQALVRLARKYDALIIADDVYDFVHFPTDTSSAETPLPPFRPILPRLVDIDRTLDGGPVDRFGHCMSNGSFSKIVGPGCRVGWAEGTPAFAYGLSQAGSTRSGGAPSHMMSTFINEMLGSGSDGACAMTTHILHTLIPAYARRYALLTSAVKQYLVPLGVLPSGENEYHVGGGFFFWLQLPCSLTSTEVVTAAQQDGVVIGDGTLSALPEGNPRCGTYEDMIRLCFAWVEEAQLVEGVRILGGTIERLVEHKGMAGKF